MRAWKRFETVLSWFVFVGSVIASLFLFREGLWHSIGEFYPFRESQTAISAYWLLKGGPWFAYETPVMGPPWSIPFEFPFYQWCVAVLSFVSSFPIEVSGRVVSKIFYLLCGIPIAQILGWFGANSNGRRWGVALFYLSPIYLYWSRTVMIETTALFFGLVYSAGVLRHVLPGTRLGSRQFVWTVVAGVLGVLVKVTTFYGFALFAGAVCALDASQSLWTQVRKRHIVGDELKRHALRAVFFAGVPYLAVKVWTRFADLQKLHNPLAAGFINSEAMKEWNFGKAGEAWKPEIWFEQVPQIWMADAFGHWGIAVFAAVLLVLQRSWKTFVTMVLFFALYMAVYVQFPHLHLVHGYYQCANAVFFVLGIALAISRCLVEPERVWVRAAGVGIGCAVLVMSALWSETRFLPYQRTEKMYDAELIQAVRSRVSEQDVVWITGEDWSSEWPYVFQRRAVVDRGDLSIESEPVQKILSHLARENRRVTAFYSSHRLDNKKMLETARKLGFSDQPVLVSKQGTYLFGKREP